MKMRQLHGAQIQTEIWKLSKTHCSLTKKPTTGHQDDDKSPAA